MRKSVVFFHAVALLLVVLALGGASAQGLSTSELYPLRATVNRLERDLASTRHELTEFTPRYLTHQHRLNVELAAAPQVPGMVVHGPDVRLLLHQGEGDALLTSAPR